MVLVLVVYDRCRPLGGGGGAPLNGLHRDVPLDRVFFTSPPPPPPPPVLRGVRTCWI